MTKHSHNYKPSYKFTADGVTTRTSFCECGKFIEEEVKEEKKPQTFSFKQTPYR